MLKMSVYIERGKHFQRILTLNNTDVQEMAWLSVTLKFNNKMYVILTSLLMFKNKGKKEKRNS